MFFEIPWLNILLLILFECKLLNTDIIKHFKNFKIELFNEDGMFDVNNDMVASKIKWI